MGKIADKWLDQQNMCGEQAGNQTTSKWLGALLCSRDNCMLMSIVHKEVNRKSALLVG